MASELRTPIARPDLATLLPEARGSLNTDIRVSGVDELRTELVRSRVFESVAQEVAAAGVDVASFEFGLVIKW